MRVIPVLDVRRGRAVHATGGDRARYRPLRSRLAAGSDPAVLAEAVRCALGLDECYVADLDAIEGRSTNDELVPELARRGFRAWVDAGITDPGRVRRTLEAGAERVIVGLETLSGAAALAKIAEADTRGRLAFSLDLRDGRPIVGAPDLVGATPLELAARAHDAGYRTVIVLDLGRVGGLGGPAQDVLPELRARFPEMELIIGGGVGGLDDLRDAAARGCDGALVGTAIHTDRITRREIERVRDL